MALAVFFRVRYIAVSSEHATQEDDDMTNPTHFPRRIDSTERLRLEIEWDLHESPEFRRYRLRYLTYSQLITRLASTLIYRATDMGLTFLDDWSRVFDAEPFMLIVRRLDSPASIRVAAPSREVRRVR